MSAFGIIFSNIHDSSIPELTQNRTMAAVPFGCRYRLIDFTLSNMVGAGISNVGVITHCNYRSLMEHIGSGKDWDLARRTGGVKVLPPFLTAFENRVSRLYESRLEALLSVAGFISSAAEEYVVLSDCDVVCNLDLKEMLTQHIQSEADITMAVKTLDITPEMARNIRLVESDETGRITGILECPPLTRGKRDVQMNIWVMKKQYLQSLLVNAAAHRYTSFTDDILARNMHSMRYHVYRYDGYFSVINSFSSYYRFTMELLQRENRQALFCVEDRPVLTRVQNSPPTKYYKTARVKNSLIADGCRIQGTVENSVLFRGVKIGRDTVVKNCILFQDTFTGENVKLDTVLCDRGAVLRDGVSLQGNRSKPVYLEAGAML